MAHRASRRQAWVAVKRRFRGRRIAIELLESRCLLTAVTLPTIPLLPSEPSTTPSVAPANFKLTTTASSAPVYLPGVEIVSGEVEINDVESGPLINLDAFQADPRFQGIDGRGFSSVIIDSGIDLDHPFFGPDSDSNGIADRIVFQYDFSGTNDGNASDFNGHGSNVASIVGSQDGTYRGMAPASGIIALKVFPDASSTGSFADVEEALQWVVANAENYNIASVNMSLGDGGNYSLPLSGYGLGDELAALAAMNVLVVSSAGNDYFQFGTQGVAYPAADPNSLAVGAVWDSDNGGAYFWGGGSIDFTSGADRIASFSQRSTSMVDIFSPGTFITGANQNGGITSFAGTSQAAPHVAGIATLAQQLAVQVLGRRLTPAEFADLLNASGVTIYDGDDEDDNVPNTNQFYRRVDVLALAEAMIPPGEIHGAKWNDLDGDGVWDQTTEPGLPGWTIYVDLNNDGQFYLGPDGQTSEVEANNSIGGAQNMDGAPWSLASNPDISQSLTLPHISIAATGNGTFDYYSFTVSQANTVGVFDMDYTNFNTELFLYDSAGNLLASNDNAAVEPGSSSIFDSLISYVFATPGRYVIGVGEFDSAGDPGGITGNTPDTGDVYTLQISIQHHGVAEVEPNDSIATAQDTDGSLWSRLSNPHIDQSTTLPHISIAGTGDGTFDYYSFTVSQPNSVGIFDIDYTNFECDTYLFLYDMAGNPLASNDDTGFDPGSTGAHDSYINYVFATPGTYVIGVGKYNSFGNPGGIAGHPPGFGDSYTLHISIENHPVVEPFTVTGADGSYSFLDIAPGVYTVAEVLQPGWVQTNPGPEAATALIVNGGFESGSFSGWTLVPDEYSASGFFVANDGSYDPASPDGPAPPYRGDYSVLYNSIGPGIHSIYQDLVVPSGYSLTLRWADRIRNHHLTFYDPNQEYRVEIRDTNNQVLATVFSTNPGDPPMQDWTQRSVDLAAFAGQTIRIAFVVEESKWFFNVHLDDVRITTAGAPGTYLVSVSPNQVVTDVDFGNHFVGFAADLNSDGFVNTADIDILWNVIRGGLSATAVPMEKKDLNGDGFVNEDDLDYLLANLVFTPQLGHVVVRYGDADLSGGVPDLIDYNLWRTGAGGWSGGDFDGSGGPPDINDFNLWADSPEQFPGAAGLHGGGVASVAASVTNAPPSTNLVFEPAPAVQGSVVDGLYTQSATAGSSSSVESSSVRFSSFAASGVAVSSVESSSVEVSSLELTSPPTSATESRHALRWHASAPRPAEPPARRQWHSAVDHAIVGSTLYRSRHLRRCPDAPAAETLEKLFAAWR